MDDQGYMRRALELAARGRGRVEPNPMVGCVVVRDGRVVGEGWHQQFGGPHAEVNAIAAAGELARGATLYVTLEPCCTVGKTPPCTDAVLAAGVRRVVIGAMDPTQSRGVALLGEAGIDVTIGVLGDECRDLLRPFLKLNRRGLPYVIAKWAMSLDGKIATRTGDARWISGEESRALVHRWRGEVDAIAVGIGTMLADDPQLTARPSGPRTALRVVFDSQGRTPLTSRLVATAHEAPVCIFTTDEAPVERVSALREAGCEVVALPAENGRPSLEGALRILGERRLTNLFVEGGGQLLGALFRGGLVDEARVFIAPLIIGGADAPSPVADTGAGLIARAHRLHHIRHERIGDDLLVSGCADAIRAAK